MRPSVALVGKQGSGKTSIAQELVTKYGYVRHSWAEPVRQIFEMAYGEIVDYAEMKAQLFEVTLADGTTALRTGREMLQRIGTEALRDQVDQEFWIKAGVRRIFRDGTVSDDTRFLNEANALRNLGWLIVRVTAPEETRRTRLKAGVFAPNHPSEVEQEQIHADYEIVNDGVQPIDVVTHELYEWMTTWTLQDLLERPSVAPAYP